MFANSFSCTLCVPLIELLCTTVQCRGYRWAMYSCGPSSDPGSWVVRNARRGFRFSCMAPIYANLCALQHKQHSQTRSNSWDENSADACHLHTHVCKSVCVCASVCAAFGTIRTISSSRCVSAVLQNLNSLKSSSSSCSLKYGLGMHFEIQSDKFRWTNLIKFGLI